MKQATSLTCKEPVSFKMDGKGRTITFKAGQEFWVTNSEVDQNNRQRLNVARNGAKIGYDFTPEQVSRYFVQG
jgi:hypothetical protein